VLSKGSGEVLEVPRVTSRVAPAASAHLGIVPLGTTLGTTLGRRHRGSRRRGERWRERRRCREGHQDSGAGGAGGAGSSRRGTARKVNIHEPAEHCSRKLVLFVPFAIPLIKGAERVPNADRPVAVCPLVIEGWEGCGRTKRALSLTSGVRTKGEAEQAAGEEPRATGGRRR
jgi:hypothetical protein